MAIFEDENSAVQAGIEMLETLKEYNKKNRNTESRQPIRIGIGIHSGQMMFGTVGEVHRMDSTVISDAVNLASRIESITKNYGSSLLISEDIYNCIESSKSMKLRYIDQITVKGKNIPTKIYEIYNSDSDEVISKKDQIKELYESSLKLFYENQFKKSQAELKKALVIYPDDKPSIHLKQRLDEVKIQTKTIKK
jgi:hypothetical protein